MPESSLLETTAEVAVAFAGFIGVFLVLATRDGRFHLLDAISIRVIVVCSVSPVFYAALPLVLDSLGISGDALWRVSSGVTAVSGVAIAVNLLPKIRALPIAERLPRTSPRLFIVWALGGLSIACLIGNIVGWPWPPSGGLHLLAIWSLVAVAGTNFVVLIFDRVL